MKHTLRVEWLFSKVILFKTLMSTNMIPSNPLSWTKLSLDNLAENESLILIESLLAKESKMHCSVAYSSMTLEGASSSKSSDYADESDMVGRLRRKMRSKRRWDVGGRMVTALWMRCTRKDGGCFIDEM
jgi:hypothetical protein